MTYISEDYLFPGFHRVYTIFHSQLIIHYNVSNCCSLVKLISLIDISKEIQPSWKTNKHKYFMSRKIQRVHSILLIPFYQDFLHHTQQVFLSCSNRFFIVNSERNSHLFLVFLFLNFSRQLFSGYYTNPTKFFWLDRSFQRRI